MPDEQGKTGTTKREPLMLIISSPSGGGKTTIINNVLKEVPGIKRTVSYTTRAPRSGEKNGEDYIFIAEKEFRDKIEKNELLEWEKNFEHYYGTLTKQVEDILGQGDDIIFSIDVKGARRVKEKFPESIRIFIMPPSLEELTARLKGRNTEKSAEVKLRIEESRREMAAADEYDYLIVNDDLGSAVGELKQIIETERANRNKAKKR